MPAKQDARHILSISGGKDSTALAIYMHDKYPEIKTEYVFCDTHKECIETYPFLNRLEGYLGQEITRLEPDMQENAFDYFLKLNNGFLPSRSARWCTKNLKIKPFERFVGDKKTKLYIAIRADENRKGYISTKSNIEPVYPFIDDGVTKTDVFSILAESGVELPSFYEYRHRSGCYFCFFQTKEEWVGLLETHPDLFEQAKQYEKPEIGFTWVEGGESLTDIEKPERIAQIKANAEKRRQWVSKRRMATPISLQEQWAGINPDRLGEDDGCDICHL